MPNEFIEMLAAVFVGNIVTFGAIVLAVQYATGALFGSVAPPSGEQGGSRQVAGPGLHSQPDRDSDDDSGESSAADTGVLGMGDDDE